MLPATALAQAEVRLDTTFDLETVVRRALDVSPAAAAADQGLRTAESEGRVALGEYVPTLSANSSMLTSNISSTPPGSGVPPSSYGANLAASLDLFTGGRRGADRTRAESDLGAARATQIAQRFSVTLAAQSAFYATLRASDLVEVAKAGVAEAQQGLRYADDRVRAGTATRSDKLRAQLQLTASRQQLVAAMDTLQTAAYSLGRIVGADGPVGASRPASLDPRALSLTDSEIVQLAIDRSPTVQAARASESAQKAVTQSARSQYLPDIKVTSAYNWANQSLIVGSMRPGWNVLIGTSYPLFNGFQREDQVTRADASAEVARVTTQDVVREARADAARLLSGLRFAEENIALAKEGAQSAEEDLRVQTERYRAGISTELDQLTSQTAYTQAQISLVAARYHYQLTRAELEALVGRTL